MSVTDPETEQPARKMLWPDPKRGPWLIEAGWGVAQGRWECVGLEVRSYRLPSEAWAKALPEQGQGQAVTSGFWRTVPVSSVIAKLRSRQIEANQRDLTRARKAKAPEWAIRDFEEALAMWRAPVLTDGPVLERVASIYLDAWRSGGKPTKAVSDQLAISPKAASKRVWEARKAGLLPEARPGKASGNVEGNQP
jgi:hypothetical protein